MPLTKTQLSKLRAERVGSSGNKVEVAMKLAGLTQVELADAMGITQPQVSAVATGRYPTVMLRTAALYAQYFGCTVDDLFPLSHAVAS